MRRLAISFILMLAVIASCTQRPDDKEFIRDMYENSLYEDCSFLEKHCTKSLLNKLSEQYDYAGEGYAVWKFRSGAQDGPFDEHSMTCIEDEGDGWYRYTATDMGSSFTINIDRCRNKGSVTAETNKAEAFAGGMAGSNNSDGWGILQFKDIDPWVYNSLNKGEAAAQWTGSSNGYWDTINLDF